MCEQKNSQSGFTRTDLLVVIGTILFLGVVWIRPTLAGFSPRADEAVCANNLRLIGQAFLQRSQEQGERNAWWISMVEGGTKASVWHANLWFQFFWVSNELASPRYLADPAEDWVRSRVATSWGTESTGLLNPNFKNNAISYFLGLHASPLQPQSILAGDGNTRGDIPGTVGCGTGIPAAPIRRQSAVWAENLHGSRGNLLFNDGRVEMTTAQRLKEAVDWNTNWNVHLLKPRLP